MIQKVEPIKAVAKVKFNDGYAYVLNRDIKFQYTKIDRFTIIGEDEGALSFFKYEPPSPNWKAFGGRKFELLLTDGTVEKCYGQWWDGWSDAARQLFDVNQICCFTFSTIEELRKCYVYTGVYALKDWLKKLDDAYKGEIYEYWEYQKVIQ